MNTTEAGTIPFNQSTAMNDDNAPQVLLLDDDEEFQTIVGEFLSGHGYRVVGVSNGVEGVRALMDNEFEYIICDMMMPALPGDMFFLAVQRMRPHLCSRFIFMTGHKGDQKVMDFVQRVNGTMIAKPFRVSDLIEMIGFLQVRALLAA
jgi:CheY-like chemotaxis protein